MTTVTVPLLGVDETPHNLGGRLCLAFVNTLWWRRSEAPIEQLHAYDDVVGSVARAGWLDGPGELAAQAARRPIAARREVQRAVALRENLAAVFAALAAGEEPPPPDALAHVEAVAARGFAHLTLTPSATGGTSGYRLRWDRPALDVPAQQVAVSAVLLLASDELDRVKQCDGPTCGWVFLDTSRNRSRRWCDSRECGNRERVRAHYVRTHSS